MKGKNNDVRNEEVVERVRDLRRRNYPYRIIREKLRSEFPYLSENTIANSTIWLANTKGQTSRKKIV